MASTEPQVEQFFLINHNCIYMYIYSLEGFCHLFRLNHLGVCHYCRCVIGKVCLLEQLQPFRQLVFKSSACGFLLNQEIDNSDVYMGVDNRSRPPSFLVFSIGLSVQKVECGLSTLVEKVVCKSVNNRHLRPPSFPLLFNLFASTYRNNVQLHTGLCTQQSRS